MFITIPVILCETDKKTTINNTKNKSIDLLSTWTHQHESNLTLHQYFVNSKLNFFCFKDQEYLFTAPEPTLLLHFIVFCQILAVYRSFVSEVAMRLLSKCNL